LITPPLGKCLVVVAALTDTNYWRLASAALPFVVAQLLVLLALAYWPQISLSLPHLAGFSAD
ncbi:MAG: TRAP transporter large permease, partial [Roseovarius sp.]